jgi:hypothetical protein
MTATGNGEERVQRLAEEQYLSLVKCEELGAGDGRGYRLVDAVTGTPMAAIGLPRGAWQSLTEIEHELTSGAATDALRRCQRLFAEAARHGLTLESRQLGKTWAWNAREVCGMPVATDMSYTDLRRFLEQRQELPLIATDSRAASSVGAQDFSLTAY